MKLDRIDYNGGEIWVDKEAKIKVGDTYVLIATDGIDEPTYLIRVLESNYKPFGFKVVAQSITNPSYIDGVPFVEVGEESVEDKARLMMMNYLTDGNPNGDFKKSTIGADENIRWWIKGYKAAQAKQFTEEDLRYAINRVYNYVDGDGWSRDYITEEVFKELKPKVSSIEIEMITEWWDNNLNCWVGAEDDDTQHSREVPKTYQKDGKTFLKVSKINYA